MTENDSCPLAAMPLTALAAMSISIDCAAAAMTLPKTARIEEPMKNHLYWTISRQHAFSEQSVLPGKTTEDTTHPPKNIT